MFTARRLGISFLVLAAAACGNKPGGPLQLDAGEDCVSGIDVDGDDFGFGCPSGPDCNDTDPAIHTGCPQCAGDTPQPGCPCDPTQAAVSCFDGTPAQAATPPCQKGIRECDTASGTWGPCGGQVAPAAESCNSIDDDCDGVVDDGVLSACGDCTPGCDTTSTGDGTPFPLPGDPLPPGTAVIGSDGVGLDPSGDIILDSTTIELHFLWVANAGEGTVSKLDTVTGKEVGRYASVTHAALVDVMGVGAGSLPAWGGVHSPSRTAIDYHGNCWVGNRAFGTQPSATKIFNDLADCQDRNGDGLKNTSQDLNGNGVIEMGTAEFLGEADECIAFTVIAGISSVPDYVGARAIAIDAGIEPGDPGNAWVGVFSEQAFYQLDGATGALVKRVPATGGLGVTPYGATIDSSGTLWAPHGCCGANGIISINTITGAVGPIKYQPSTYCPDGGTGYYGGSYGIAADATGNVWLGGWPCAAVFRYSPATDAWAVIQIPGYFGAGWGVRGVGADALGNMWAAVHMINWTEGAVARFDSATATFTGIWDIVGTVPVGTAADFDGAIWTVNGSTNNASRLYIDPTSSEPAPNPATGNVVDVFPVGSAPYTYSDFTGLGLRTITRPSGDYTVVLEGCTDLSQATWNQIDFDATAPAGTALELWVRAGDDLATRGSWPQYGPWVVSPALLQFAPGPVPNARFLEVTFRLMSIDRESSPILHSYDVEWTCPVIPID
jgi:streptogramin lyase